MDWRSLSERIMDSVRKYRYVLLIALAGIFLMVLPEKNASEKDAKTEQSEIITQIDLQDDLAEILSKIEGAGKVDVLLTQSEGEKILYQTDEDISTDTSSSDIRKDTVLITGNDRNETGLVRQINPPTYLGAIILCQGADKAGIRLSIVEAVMGVTGLTSDKITVLKMK